MLSLMYSSEEHGLLVVLEDTNLMIRNTYLFNAFNADYSVFYQSVVLSYPGLVP